MTEVLGKDLQPDSRGKEEGVRGLKLQERLGKGGAGDRGLAYSEGFK